MYYWLDKVAGLTKAVSHCVNTRKKEMRWRREDQRQMARVDLPDLSDTEISELKKTWPFLKFQRDDLYWARLYKKEYGFNPFFISSVNQCYQLRAKLNPYNQVCSLENKALVDTYLPGIPFPEVFVRCINGCLFDKEMHALTFDEATSLLEAKKQFVIKPALGSMCGRGVRRIDLSSEHALDDNWFRALFAGASDSFIAQEVLSQHPDIARLNPSSLNCCRITSVWVNGIYRYGIMLKVGKKGSQIDNWNSGYLVGIQEDGTLKEKGWDDQLQPVYESDSGIRFEEVRYPCLDLLRACIESYHKRYFPQCGIVGWDVVIDAEQRPRVVEANLSIPGIPAEQLCSGAFLKDVRDELCNIFAQAKHKQ